jgi:hypothetical protein
MVDSNDMNEALRGVREQQERTIALASILNNAPDIGIDEALETYGAALTDSEKEVLKTLTREELDSLKSILSKIGTELLSPITILPII